MVTGNADNTFSIDDHLGILTVVKELDRRIHSSFEMVVSVTDRGDPPLTGTVTVIIDVTVSTNSPPKFLQDEYTVELLENAPPSTLVVSLIAESLSTVVYAIGHGNEEGYFTINPNSGTLSTMRPIDFEEKQYFNLTVEATNMVSATQSVYVIVHIVDLNDNAPKFLWPVYFGNVSESAVPGSMVLDLSRSPLVIQASDSDSNNNARLFYEILHGEVQNYFSIDLNTGAIWTAAPLDYETIKMFNFSVQVSDTGIPQLQAQDTAAVIIYVTDVNDCPPQFTQHTYQALVVLPTYFDVPVVQVLAVDPDTVSDEPLRYSIQGGNEEEAFYINSEKGIIYVQNDGLSRDKYDLTVQVTDGKFTTVAHVAIQLQQAEKTTLKFTKDRFVHVFPHI